MATSIALLYLLIVCLGIDSTKSQNWANYLPIQSDSPNYNEPLSSYQITNNDNRQIIPAIELTTQDSGTEIGNHRYQTDTLTPVDYNSQNDQENNGKNMSLNLNLHPPIDINDTNPWTKQEFNDDEFTSRNHTIIQVQNANQNDSYGENNRDQEMIANHRYSDTSPEPGYRPAIAAEPVDPSNWKIVPPSNLPGYGIGGERVGSPGSLFSSLGGDGKDGGDKVSEKSPSFQWHVGIYSKAFKPYMQICGGTLVTTKAVISAAHCFWNDVEGVLPATRFAVAAGKLHRPWLDIYDFYAQTSEVLAIHLPPRFRGVSTNFQDDIAVVAIATPFKLSRTVRPACVLFDEDLESHYLRDGNEGIVLGWGLTAEDGPPSQSLLFLRMPYVPIEECIAGAQPDFLKYITSDKICAGVTNGNKALCRGDSGGGLIFFDNSTSEQVPLLFGVASTAPRNEHLCNARARASLTRILAHRAFLRTHIPEIEDTCRRNYKAYSISTTIGLASRIANPEVVERPPPQQLQPTFICNCYCNNSTSP